LSLEQAIPLGLHCLAAYHAERRARLHFVTCSGAEGPAFAVGLERERKPFASRANDGKGLVATTSPLDTGFGFSYFPNLHIGAKGWYLIAAQSGIHPGSVTKLGGGRSDSHFRRYAVFIELLNPQRW
jgi:hypothetical protein